MSLCIDTYSNSHRKDENYVVFVGVYWAAWECCRHRRRFLRTAASAVSGLCSWLCHMCRGVVTLGDPVWDIIPKWFSVQVLSYGHSCLCHCATLNKPTVFPISTEAKLPTGFWTEGNCAGFAPSISKYTVDNLEYLRLKDTSGSLLSRHLSKCAFLQSEIALPKPQKSWDLKIVRDGDDATSQGEGTGKKGASWDVNQKNRECPK